MQITDTRLKITPPENAEKHDDTESVGHFQTTLRNHGDRTDTVRIVYSLAIEQGRSVHEEIALAVEPGESRTWEGALSLFSRFEQPCQVELTARISVNGKEHEARASFEVSDGPRPRTYDPARQNMPSGGNLRGEV